MWCRKIAMRAWWRPELGWAALLLLSATSAPALTYLENFDKAGRPSGPAGVEWTYRAELSPVDDWTGLVPGDGYAYLSAEHELVQQRRRSRGTWPFQKMSFGPVSANHRISLRAKNTAIPGLAAMLFTYRDQGGIDEIDIEIVAQDTESSRPHHRTGPDGGWTDARFVTWIGADLAKPVPATLVRQPLRDAQGEKVSHQDDRFHVYTIEWYAHEVRFLVDGVLQETIRDAVPDRPTRVIFGLRKMPWAGDADWTEPQTMTVDWLLVEPLE
jgi:hypothetical protein